MALLPQFTSPNAAWPAGVQMMVLGVLHVSNCALVYFAVGYGAATVLTRRPRAAKIVGILSSLVMTGLGIALIVDKLARMP